MTHTKGRWKFNGTKTALLAFNSKNEFRVILSLQAENPLEPLRSDAKLIEAAPEMFSALESCLKLAQDPDTDEFQANKLIEEIETVLKKARGQ